MAEPRSLVANLAALFDVKPDADAARPAAPLRKSQRPGTGIRYVLADPNSTPAAKLSSLQPRHAEGGRLAKSVLNMLDGPDDSVERLAFERDPQRISEFAGIYRPKLQLLPDSILKRIIIQDDLVAAAVHTRANHVSQFGRKQTDRHQKGFKFEVDKSVEERLDSEGKKRLQQRIDRADRLLATCGHTKGYRVQEQCSFVEYLYMSTRNVVGVGRMATEVVYTANPDNPSERKFHSFRPVDAGTVYFAAPYFEHTHQVRKEALKLIEQLKNEKLKPEKFQADEYAWVQVLEGRPVQAFGPDELLVHTPYPSTDVELQGYPITPLDTAIAAVTTHLSITAHNKLYFQSGRATRGMLVIKSPDVDQEVVTAVKQQFNASINSVNNSWRMPVFGIGPEDELTWAPIDNGQRDMEFQYLSDQNARTILAAFQMSPDELPGYQHLSRGTNNQSLSESQEEYKLIAARDVGIRPLIASIEDFLNTHIVPLIDPDLAKIARLRLIGLDVKDEEKESIRLQQDAPVHMTYNDILQVVEKKPLPKLTGADLPLNPTFYQYIEKYMTFGQILEHFCGVEGAADPQKRPDLAFYQNPIWLQWQDMQMQAQMAQQQAQQPQGAPPSGGGGQPQPQDPNAAPGGGQPLQQSMPQDLGSGVDQLLEYVVQKSDLLAKGEKNLPETKKKLRARQRVATKLIMAHFHDEMSRAVKDIADIAEQHAPRKSGKG